MDLSSDPRASGFSAAEFRDNIRFAMQLGLPENESERCTFRWTVERTYATADSGGNPYDFAEEPTATVTHADVLVPAAVEFSGGASGGGSNGTPVGDFHSGRATITLLDEDYAQIEGADLVLLGGNTYKIKYVGPPLGLFDVTVYQLFCQAVSES